MIYRENRQILRARDDVLAGLYRCLRIADKSEPLKDESLQLYQEVEIALIDATREIYEKRIERAREEEARATDKED